MTTKQELAFLLSGIGNNPTRRSLTFLHIKVESSKTVMTTANAYIIKRVETCSDMADGEYFLSGECLKAAVRKAKKKSAIHFDKNGLHVDDITFTYNVDGIEYPNLDSLMNPRRYGGTPPIDRIGFIPIWLIDVLKNAPSDVVKFSFDASSQPTGHGYDGPVKIDFYGYPEYAALIMPIRLKF